MVSVDMALYQGLGVQADGRRLPFRDRAFSTSVCIDVLEHVAPDQRPALVAELRRVTSDLLIVGGPLGRAAEEADRRLAAWFDRNGRPLPDWLAEHLATGRYPTLGELDEVVGGEPLERSDAVGVWGHRALAMGQHVRGGWRAGRWLASSPSRLRVAARLSAAAGEPYRQVLTYDLAPVEFSVIMATQNRAGRLADAVSGVLAQTDEDFELVIVDDASVDETPAVTARLAAGDPRVRVIRNDVAAGSCGLARNVGVSAARGRWLAFCDDDVRWRPHHLATCRPALAGADVCWTQAERFLPDGSRYDVVGRAYGPEGPQLGDVDANTIAVTRASMVPFPDGRGRYHSEDILLAMKLWRNGSRITFVPEVTVDYLFNLDSLCFRYSLSDEDGVTHIAGRPRFDDWRSVRNRILEKLEYEIAPDRLVAAAGRMGRNRSQRKAARKG